MVHRRALFTFVLIVLLAAAWRCDAAEPKVRRMQANDPASIRVPPDPKTAPLYPSDPIPGYPGADPKAGDAAGAIGAEWRKDIYVEPFARPAWAWPELQNYPGSIEHYRMADMNMLPAINIYNERTLVVNHLVVDLPGVPAAAKETFAEPVYYVWHKWHPPGYRLTDQRRAPVPVVRLRAGGPRLRFDLGPLSTSLYCVRLVAATETKDCRDSIPLDLIVDMKINDGPDGEVNHYVLRQKPIDQFYSFGEFFFHANDDRVFHFDLGLHPTSKVDLLVHNVDVHNMLAECVRRGAKQRSILSSADTLQQQWQSGEAAKNRAFYAEFGAKRIAALHREFPDRTDAELAAIDRRRRDDILWNVVPPINSHYNATNVFVKSEADPQTMKALEEGNLLPVDGYHQPTNGSKWDAAKPWNLDLPLRAKGGMLEAEFGQAPLQFAHPWQLLWEKKGGETVTYTLDDLRANRPLPGYPFEVYPWGKRFQWGDNAGLFFPVAQRTGAMFNHVLTYLQNQASYGPFSKYWVKSGSREFARDLALVLCRVAYDAPSYVVPHDIYKQISGPEHAVWKVGLAHRHRARNYQFIYWTRLGETYDLLFDFIKDNQELADAVGRYVPWVKTPRDVIALLDTYIIQYGARESMYYRYYFGYEQPQFLAEFAALQGDPAISRPWLEMLYSRAWVLFTPPSSIVDQVYQSTQRDGTPPIGSFSYAMGGRGAFHTVRWLERYIEQGGDPKYDLKRLCARVIEMPRFQLESVVAGCYSPQAGDVGPIKPSFAGSDLMHDGWRWFHDPRFAWCLVNFGERATETDAEWAAIEAAAKTVTRDPFYSQHSRVLSDWAGILEGNADSDDARLKYAAAVRVGWGSGHSHADSLDLHLIAMDRWFMPDHGQRPGYGKPEVGASKIHNVLTVGDANFHGHTWVSEIADLFDCHYLRAEATYQRKFERQVVLIGVDPGGLPPFKPTAREPWPTSRKYWPAVGEGLPQLYAVDFFRAAGGDVHAYNFHGAIEDEFTVDGVKREPLSPADEQFLKGYIMQGEQWGGKVDGDLAATWRLSREKKKYVHPQRGERTVSYVGDPGNDEVPRKYLRVHVPGQAGARFLSGLWVAAPYQENRTDGHMMRQAHLLRTVDPNKGSLVAAVYEPFSDKPTIAGVRLEGDVNDPSGFAALHIDLTQGGRDLCFADDTGAQERVLEDGATLRARFVHLSRDKDGLRRAALVGGTLLRSKEVTIRTARDEWSAKVVSADYEAKTAVLDAALPERVLDGAFFAVGCERKEGPRGMTSFEAADVTPIGAGSRVAWRKDPSVHAAEIEQVSADAGGEYGAALVMNMATPLKEGEREDLVLRDEATGKLYRCDVVGNKASVRGASPKDFKAGERITLFAFGAGDVWRLPTFVALQRQPDGTWRVHANTGFELILTLPDGSTVSRKVAAAELGEGTFVIGAPGRP